MKVNLIHRLTHGINQNTYIYRDDLYPFIGGGNKGRKINTIAQDMLNQKATAIVTTGGINSNHCRVTSIFAAQNDMKCTLVLHGDEKIFYHQQGNSKLMRDAGAQLVFVKDPAEISVKMDQAMQQYTQQGEMPYYLWGGGHSIAGAAAYMEAVAELAELRNQTGWEPKFIFLASGTGSTQAGIMAGLDKYSFNKTTVIGISIARQKISAEKIINDFYLKTCTYFNLKPLQKTVVIDDYLCGGYEHFNAEILQLSQDALRKYGFILDTTYTGKAFYGMQKYLQGQLASVPVLFWHTGGLLNYIK